MAENTDLQMMDDAEDQVLKETHKRNIGNRMKWFVTIWSVFAVIVHLYSIFIAYLTPQVHMALHLMFTLSLSFLLYKPYKTEPMTTIEKIPFYDYMLFMLALVVNMYIVTNWLDILRRAARPTNIDLMMSFILICLILEGTRRVMGKVLPIIALIFSAYAFFGYMIPGFMGHRGTSIPRYFALQFMTTEGIWSTPTQVASRMIFMFTLFGAFLLVSGAGDRLMEIALAFAGKYRGGPGKVAVVASGLLGMVSGSASANVATTGQFTIPMMKKMGFTAQMAGAVEAVASTGGTLAPPIMGAGAFIMAEILGISYLVVVKAAIIPAVIYYTSAFTVIHFESRRLGLEGLPQDQIPGKLKSLLHGTVVIIPILVLLYLVFTYYPIMRAALISIIVLIAVSIFKKETRIGFGKIISAMETCMRNLVTLSLCCACAGIVVGCIAVTGLGPKFAAAVVMLAGDYTLLALIIGMIVTIILGMGLPATAAYVVAASVAAPALIRMDFDPLAVQMFVFYFSCLAQITPPIALASYVGAAIAGSDPLKTAITSMRLGLVAIIVPFMFIYDPTLLMVGRNTEIAWNSMVAIIGVVGAAIGLAGFFRYKMNHLSRIACVLGGLSLVQPGTATDLVGIIVISVVLTLNFLQKKKISKNESLQVS